MSEQSIIDGIDYGPLAALLGVWKGGRGVDRAPEPDGEERNPYYETITFEAAGDVTNYEKQVLSVVRYHQLVSRKSNDKVFHDQVGFWLWDPATGDLMESFAIPRAVAVVASGILARPASLSDELVFSVSCELQGIAQSPIMYDKARTTAFTHTLTVRGDQMRYTETTLLDIYEKRDYEHTDVNTLTRVG
ncbi:MAG: heme-binding beta-barrel domain-containing protein [Parahaliea sp.]